MNGMVFKRDIEGDIQKASDAKIAVYSCAIDISQTETKGTVLIKTANELLNYSKNEEDLLEKVLISTEIFTSGFPLNTVSRINSSMENQ